ncbi:hypothetical protein PIROE2DRAFT_64208 [Piromyces sp. E2]|nr:hypothetical protein PIROE2DRAFT_64208 [Piromyces sp. E2]|eukprot:OUM58745.1 hypothetical protein PIROE2DRAFT_64208 [Piromyces sp. E2]
MRCENKEDEGFINSVFSDMGLHLITTSGYISNYIKYFMKYDITYKITKNKICSTDKFDYYENRDKDMESFDISSLFFNNKDIFSIEKKINYFIFNTYEEDYGYDELTREEVKSICDSFKESFLKEEDINEILKNPEFIIEKTKNKIDNMYYLILIKSSVIGSLIYNNKTRGSRVFCRYNHQGISKVYDPTYFDKKSNVVYAKAIEEYAKVLGPAWFGVSWCGQSNVSSIIGGIVNFNNSKVKIKDIPEGVNHCAAVNNCVVICNALISSSIENQYSITNSDGSTITHSVGEASTITDTLTKEISDTIEVANSLTHTDGQKEFEKTYNQTDYWNSQNYNQTEVWNWKNNNQTEVWNWKNDNQMEVWNWKIIYKHASGIKKKSEQAERFNRDTMNQTEVWNQKTYNQTNY